MSHVIATPLREYRDHSQSKPWRTVLGSDRRSGSDRGSIIPNPIPNPNPSRSEPINFSFNWGRRFHCRE